MDQPTKEKTAAQPIAMSIEIPAASLKKVMEHGKLIEFVDTLSARASAHIRAQVVAAAAKGAGVSFKAAFDDDDRYGTGPHPWPHHIGVFEGAMQEVVMKGIQAKERG